MFVRQLVIRYGVHFPSANMSAVLAAISKDFPNSDGVIKCDDSDLIISMDSDEHARSGSVFIEKLTIGTANATSADGLAIDFSEEGLTRLRTRAPQACAAIARIYALAKDIDGVVKGWRTHVCTWAAPADGPSTPAPVSVPLPRRIETARRIGGGRKYHTVHFGAK